MKQTVVLTKPWGLHPKGAVLTLDHPIAGLLIDRKAAELVKPKSKKRVGEDANHHRQ